MMFFNILLLKHNGNVMKMYIYEFGKVSPSRCEGFKVLTMPWYAPSLIIALYSCSIGAVVGLWCDESSQFLESSLLFVRHGFVRQIEATYDLGLQGAHNSAYWWKIANLSTFLHTKQLSINNHADQRLIRFRLTLATCTKNVLMSALPFRSSHSRIDEITQLAILWLRSSASCKFGLYNVSLQACAMYSAANMCRYLSLSKVASATASWLAVGFVSGLELQDMVEENGKFRAAYNYSVESSKSPE